VSTDIPTADRTTERSKDLNRVPALLLAVFVGVVAITLGAVTMGANSLSADFDATTQGEVVYSYGGGRGGCNTKATYVVDGREYTVMSDPSYSQMKCGSLNPDDAITVRYVSTDPSVASINGGEGGFGAFLLLVGFGALGFGAGGLMGVGRRERART
jgi:hypothetical protein